MIGFVIGLFTGGLFGILTISLCIAAKGADEDYEQLNQENE